MGSSSSQHNNSDDEDNDPIEVYLLYKKLGENIYIMDTTISHYICLFKCSDNTFYYTDLGIDSKGGPCRLNFGRYQFLPMPAWYKPVGRTRKSLNQIEEWVQQNKTAGTSYTLVLNDCQRYAWSCIKYLDVFDVPEMFSRPEFSVLLTLQRSRLPFGLPAYGIEQFITEKLNIRGASSPNEIRLAPLI